MEPAALEEKANICSYRYNKYTSICARATRQALKEEERVRADKRGYMALRYQEWKEGKAGESVSGLQHLIDRF